MSSRKPSGPPKNGLPKPNVSLNKAAYAGEPTQDEQLLVRSSGPMAAHLHSDPWRVLRIQGEFVAGFDALAQIGPAVTLFGSARTTQSDPHYALAVDIAERLGHAGFAIITGGGPGIMEAGNRGARNAGTRSIGCAIELPDEQSVNPYVDITVNFRYFFVRKTMFVKYAEGFVIFPGGFGTLDELFEALTLIQTEKLHHFPVILVGTAYWQGLIDWIRSTMMTEGKISPRDLELILCTDDPEEVVTVITECYERGCAEVPSISVASE
ncbi:MAG: TIGR00730 family Rossman fold protein [Chloroflexota bacterium]